MGLQIFWFGVVAFFWTGFFILEGFDFGVGALHMVVGKTDVERRVAINSIGPFWDGNEVWLVVAAAATFAAFPSWYASMFSALYLAMMLILIGLILRGVSFEYRGKITTTSWRRTWSWALTITSCLLPVLLGVALGDLLHGLPINQNGDYTGSFIDLFTPYGLWLGLTFLTLTLTQGAIFLGLRTTGVVRARAEKLSHPFAWAAAVAVIVFCTWSHIQAGNSVIPSPAEALAVMLVIAAAWSVRDGHDGWAFAANSVVIALTVISVFVNLYPNVMVSSTNSAYNLTVAKTASSGYALNVMTVIAVVFVPLVLVYQGWTYHVFKARITGPRIGTETPDLPAGTDPSPVADTGSAL